MQGPLEEDLEPRRTVVLETDESAAEPLCGRTGDTSSTIVIVGMALEPFQRSPVCSVVGCPAKLGLPRRERPSNHDGALPDARALVRDRE
jgi:hypothetical protein